MFLDETMKVSRKVHQLKCAPVYFDAVKSREKTAEVRFNDREYSVGDIIELIPYTPRLGVLAEGIVRVVTHILTSDDMQGLSPGYVMLSFGDAP